MMDWKDEDDFIAILEYRTTADGGRKTPAGSGYRSQVKFPFSEMQTSGRQKFIDKEVTYPGETVKAYIKLLSPHFFEKSLEEGMKFEVREGHHVTSVGTIITILNIDLKKDRIKI
jgi:translation elongation factor EF-Tu-like GTPase